MNCMAECARLIGHIHYIEQKPGNKKIKKKKTSHSEMCGKNFRYGTVAISTSA